MASGPRPAPMQAMRWRILALLFLARVGLGFQFQTMASVGDSVAARFGLDYASVGLLIGLFMAPGLFLALPAGFSGRLASDKTLCGLGLAALSVGAIVSGVAVNPTMIGLGRLLAGVGFLISNLYFTKMVADWFQGREIATAMSILVMSWAFGIAMGQIGHAWLDETLGWRAPFLISGAYCGVAALSVLLLYQSPDIATQNDAKASLGLDRHEWPLVICAGLAWGAFNAGYVLYLSFGPMMLQSHGLSVIQAASVISIGSWLMIFSGAICGQIADRVGRRLTLVSICVLTSIVALALLFPPGFGVTASVLFGLVGMAPAGVIIALSSEATAPARRAFGMGVFFTIYFAMMTAAPPIAGALSDAFGPKSAIAMAMVLLASVIPAWLGFRHYKAKGPAPNQA